MEDWNYESNITYELKFLLNKYIITNQFYLFIIYHVLMQDKLDKYQDILKQLKWERYFKILKYMYIATGTHKTSM